MLLDALVFNLGKIPFVFLFKFNHELAKILQKAVTLIQNVSSVDINER